MTSKINYGDIVLIDFSSSIGKEIVKIRPCIVVSRQELNEYSPFFIVIPLTTNTERILTFHVLIPPTKNNGLAKLSKALPEQMRSLDKSRLVKKRGSLEPSLRKVLENKIRFVINQE